MALTKTGGSTDPLENVLRSMRGAGLVVTLTGASVEDRLSSANDSSVFIKPSGGDDTAAINTALAEHSTVILGDGVFNIDPDVGIVVHNGSRLIGSSFMRVILLAKQVGATINELAAYTKGSIIKRSFTVGVANQYVSDVYLDGFSVIMRHPETNDVNNYRQIGIDLRNCDRSIIGSSIYVGNTTLPGMPYTWEPSRSTQAQGYGIVYGTRNSNSVDYCGGVGGIAYSPKVYGARKNIVVDETQLSPQSAAHATLIMSPDLQIGVELISAASQYNAGTSFTDCLLQSMQRFTSADTTIGLLLAGYNCNGSIRYLEGGPNCDVVAAATSASKDCNIDIQYASVIGASTGRINDNGLNNSLTYREMKAASGHMTTSGRAVSTFNRGYVTRKVKSELQTGVAAQVVTGDSGVTVTRNGVGNYRVNVDKDFSGSWGVNISSYTGSSRHSFSYCLSSQSDNTVVVDTYVNGAVADPAIMYIEVYQI